MFRHTNFWFGVLVGIALFYGYMHYKARKAGQ